MLPLVVNTYTIQISLVFSSLCRRLLLAKIVFITHRLVIFMAIARHLMQSFCKISFKWNDRAIRDFGNTSTQDIS